MKIGITFCQVINKIFMLHEAIFEIFNIQEWNGGSDIFINRPINKMKLISVVSSSCEDLWLVIMYIIIDKDEMAWTKKKFIGRWEVDFLLPKMNR